MGTFYLGRHVSASVWNKDTLPARAITKAGLCETSLLRQWFFSIARHHFGKLLWEVGLRFNDAWDTFRADAFEKQSAGKVSGQREVVKSNDPWSLNYQPHGAFFRNAILPRPGATTLSLALPINYCVLTLSPKIIACQCNWATSLSLFTFMHWRRKWQPTLVFLLGESQRRGILVGCCLWGHTESDTTEAT